jgi:hypothetical protein
MALFFPLKVFDVWKLAIEADRSSCTVLLFARVFEMKERVLIIFKNQKSSKSSKYVSPSLPVSGAGVGVFFLSVNVVNVVARTSTYQHVAVLTTVTIFLSTFRCNVDVELASYRYNT